MASNYNIEIFLAEVYVTLLLTMQLSFMRQFDIECEDNALESLRVHYVSSYTLYMAKYSTSLIMAFLTVIPTMLLAFFFHGASSNDLNLNLTFLLTVTLVVIGFLLLVVLFQL